MLLVQKLSEEQEKDKWLHAHIRKNKGHTVDWNQAVFVDKEKDFEKKIK